MADALPKVAAEVSRPLSEIDKVTVIDGATGNGVGSVANNVPLVMTKIFKSIKQATGIDMTEIVKAETYDAKVNKNINVTGVSGEPVKSLGED